SVNPIDPLPALGRQLLPASAGKNRADPAHRLIRQRGHLAETKEVIHRIVRAGDEAVQRDRVTPGATRCETWTIQGTLFGPNVVQVPPPGCRIGSGFVSFVQVRTLARQRSRAGAPAACED